MNLRTIALVFGVVFTAVGILGFVPGITQMHTDHQAEGLVVGGPGHGLLLGLFHVNLLHNLFHLAFGVLGLAMSRTFDGSRNYLRLVAITYGLLTVMGLLPRPFNTTFGLVPIGGHDVWLHALLAIGAAIAGFFMTRRGDLSGDPIGTTPGTMGGVR